MATSRHLVERPSCNVFCVGRASCKDLSPFAEYHDVTSSLGRTSCSVLSAVRASQFNVFFSFGRASFGISLRGKSVLKFVFSVISSRGVFSGEAS